MQRTPTTPDTGVEERLNRVGQNRPSGESEQAISEEHVAERRLSRELKIVLSERKGGCDPERLLMAIGMLISEQGFIDYFRQQKPGGIPQNGCPRKPLQINKP